MVLFTHITPNKYAKDIIKDNQIKSFKQIKKIGLGEGANIMNPDSVFTTLLFDFYKVAIPNHNKSTYFFFDKSILTTNNVSHYCNIWEWGKITESCIKYNKSKSVDENIKSWAESYKSKINVTKFPEKYIFGPTHNFDGVANETVFKDNINFDSLVGIYSYDATWKHPLLMTTQKELKDFLYKYNICDIDIHPKLNYHIPYNISWTEEKHKQVRYKWLKWASKQEYCSTPLKRWKLKFNRRNTRKLKR